MTFAHPTLPQALRPRPVPAAAALLPLSLLLACGGGGGGTPEAARPVPALTVAVPQVTAVEPAAAAPGTEVTLAGRNLAGVTQVTLAGAGGEVQATVLASTMDTVRIRIPDMAAGAATIAVATGAGAAPGRVPFRITEAAPAPDPASNPAAATAETPRPVVSEAEREARRQARVAAGSEAGARAGHLAALARLDANLGRDHQFTGRLTGTTFRLTDEYHMARNVLDAYASRPCPAGSYRVNVSYLYADPYLATHNIDIDQLVPESVTGPEWAGFQEVLRANCQGLDPGDLSYPFSKIELAPAEVQAVLHKRIKRLFLEAQRKTARGERPVQAIFASGSTTPFQELAFDLTQQRGRCVDGLQEGLAEMEERVFGEGEGGAILHLGEFISNVLADYRMAFIKRHALLDPHSAEFPTMVVQLLKQKLLYSLGLRGRFGPIQYAGHANTDHPVLSSGAVMRRFLDGECQVRVLHGSAGLDFEAFTVDKMIDLLQEARTRGFMDASGANPLTPGQSGRRLLTDLVTAECLDAEHQPRDPVLGPAWLEFMIENLGSTGNPYFEPAPAGQFDGNVRLTREFWLHVLTKYGYLVRG